MIGPKSWSPLKTTGSRQLCEAQRASAHLTAGRLQRGASRSHGTPVVISRACNSLEVAEHRGGEIKDLDPQTIATAPVRTMTGREWHESAEAAARWMTLATHDLSQIAQGMIEDYLHG